MLSGSNASAPAIRKEILDALEKHIIPALDAGEITQFIATPPFDFSAVQHEVKRAEPLADQPHNRLQILQEWPDEQMVAIRMASFGFVYAGASYESIGATQSTAAAMAKAGHPVPAGITTVRIPAPGIICYPGGAPKHDGTPTPEPHPETGCVLAVKLLDEAVFVFLCGTTLTHSLEINDLSLLKMAQLYFEELGVGHNQRGAQGLLTAFMHRLHRYLRVNRPRIANTSWVHQDEHEATFDSATQIHHRELCYATIDYILTHLHTPLNLEGIAAHVGISGFYLNQIFAREQGTTVMRYVTHVRVEAAKKILREQPDQVSDVAKLVGFAGVSSFSATFHKLTGLSPSEFRRRERLW